MEDIVSQSSFHFILSYVQIRKVVVIKLSHTCHVSKRLTKSLPISLSHPRSPKPLQLYAFERPYLHALIDANLHSLAHLLRWSIPQRLFNLVPMRLFGQFLLHLHSSVHPRSRSSTPLRFTPSAKQYLSILSPLSTHSQSVSAHRARLCFYGIVPL